MKEQDWIPVGEGLPEKPKDGKPVSHPVLGAIAGRDYPHEVVYVFEPYNVWLDTSKKQVEITHWQPFPKTPGRSDV